MMLLEIETFPELFKALVLLEFVSDTLKPPNTKTTKNDGELGIIQLYGFKINMVFHYLPLLFSHYSMDATARWGDSSEYDSSLCNHGTMLTADAL
jgi:hypothetical protein